MSIMQVSGLFIYPVKSMRGIEQDSAVLTPQGLRGDRRFMVVRADGRFVTQRDLPALALIQVRLDSNGILLSREGRGSIGVPFGSPDGERIRTRVWQDECETTSLGREISIWLTRALDSDAPLKLVRMAPGFIRPQSQPENLGAETHTHFADSAPFLVTNQASLAALNGELDSRGQDTVPMNRFRPNIVVRGLEAFAEHRIGEISAERYRLKFCHPCQRCVVTTIDQDTGLKDPSWQPYRTLVDINPMPGTERAPAFGQNAILVQGDGAKISLGDSLSA